MFKIYLIIFILLYKNLIIKQYVFVKSYKIININKIILESKHMILHTFYYNLQIFANIIYVYDF